MRRHPTARRPTRTRHDRDAAAALCLAACEQGFVVGAPELALQAALSGIAAGMASRQLFPHLVRALMTSVSAGPDTVRPAVSAATDLLAQGPGQILRRAPQRLASDAARPRSWKGTPTARLNVSLQRRRLASALDAGVFSVADGHGTRRHVAEMTVERLSQLGGRSVSEIAVYAWGGTSAGSAPARSPATSRSRAAGSTGTRMAATSARRRARRIRTREGTSTSARPRTPPRCGTSCSERIDRSRRRRSAARSAAPRRDFSSRSSGSWRRGSRARRRSDKLSSILGCVRQSSPSATGRLLL